MLNNLNICKSMRIVLYGNTGNELGSVSYGKNSGWKFGIMRKYMIDAIVEMEEEERNKKLIDDYKKYKELEREFNALPVDIKEKLSALDKVV